MTDPIHIRSGHLDVTVLPRGAALVGVRFAGRDRNLVIGFDDPQDHLDVPICAGPLVGPIANRVRGGLIEIDDTSYHMPLNENDNTLHSGPQGLHTLLWDVVKQTDHSVTLSTLLRDGDQGLPGTRRITAHYDIAGNTLTLRITATTDRATPMNIAAHPYWNLDGAADVSGHLITLSATHLLPTDRQGLPTGERHPLAETDFDFTTESPVPLTPALDTNFCLADAMRTTPQHAATLRGGDGTRLDIATTAPGLQVYAGSGLPDLDIAMNGSPPLKPYAGIALEPQHWPDAPHHRDFPQITLRPGETYQQITEMTLTPP